MRASRGWREAGGKGTELELERNDVKQTLGQHLSSASCVVPLVDYESACTAVMTTDMSASTVPPRYASGLSAHVIH
jgi:hypothetical protein